MNKENRQGLLLRMLLVLLLACAVTTGAVAQQQKSEPAQQNEQQEAEKKITPEQAKELFASVDEILQFVSKDTGLPIKHPVKRKLASRGQVEKFIEDRMKDDQDARRLERSEVVLKKFGLLPEQFDLRTFLVGLLKEQVAGFYDSKKKTIYLLDWVEPEAQRAVLAHELTHALQDQNFDLEKWAKAAEAQPAQKRKDAAPRFPGKKAAPIFSDKGGAEAELMEEERLAARQAVAEGQATVVLIDYMLAPEKESVQSNPAIADAVMAGMMSGGKTPLYIKAPMFLKELLIFPYQYGLKFESDVLANAGREAAFAGTFQNPPVDTREILQPSTYLDKEKLPLMPVPDFEAAGGKEYTKYDLAVMGEFDVWLLAKQYAGQDAAAAISTSWRGGYYYAALKPGVPNPSKRDATVPASSIALAYASKWANADAAEQFAAIYAKYLGKRYKQVEGDPGTAASMKAGAPSGQVAVGIAKGFAGAHDWKTEGGPVSIETRGDTVLVMEGFDGGTGARIADAVFGDRK